MFPLGRKRKLFNKIASPISKIFLSYGPPQKKFVVINFLWSYLQGVGMVPNYTNSETRLLNLKSIFQVEKITKIAILCLLFTLFITLSIFSHSINLDFSRRDQSAYMSTALKLKKSGGVTSFLNLCITGKYKQANRHPLYILLLSTFATRNIKFFVKSKILSTTIALSFFITFFVLIKKEFGIIISIISTIILITSRLYVTYLSWVACEYLLILCTLLTWHFSIKGFNNSKFWILGGFLNGLAYMSKASGFLLLPVFVLGNLIISLKNKSLKKSLKNKYFYFYFLSFIISSSPLLVRNIVVYNNPLYTVNGKKMWVDKYEDTFLPEIASKVSMTRYRKTI